MMSIDLQFDGDAFMESSHDVTVEYELSWGFPVDEDEWDRSKEQEDEDEYEEESDEDSW